jgi:RNA polymerase sigma-70 factor, ECF subfamily
MTTNLAAKEAPAAEKEPLAVYYIALFAYGLRRLPSRELAEELAAEVVAAAFAGKQPKGDILPWLYGVANRKLANILRKDKRQQERSLHETIPDRQIGAAEELIQEERAVEIRKLVDSLPKDQREAVLLFYVESLNAEQVAAAMHKSKTAIYSLLQRAREELRQRGNSFFSEDQI